MKNLEITVERTPEGQPEQVTSTYQIGGKPAKIMARKSLDSLWLEIAYHDEGEECTWIEFMSREYTGPDGMASNDYYIRKYAPGAWSDINDFAELSLSILSFSDREKKRISGDLERLRSLANIELWNDVAQIFRTIRYNSETPISVDDAEIREEFQRSLTFVSSFLYGCDPESEELCCLHALERASRYLIEATVQRRTIAHREAKQAADKAMMPEDCALLITAGTA